MNSQKIKESDLVKSLEKGLLVIQAFSNETKEMTISQAAQITGLSKPATRRILLTLHHLGYLNHDEQGKFTLTTKILSLGYAYFTSNEIWSSLTPQLELLCHRVDESASISVLEGHDIVYVSRYAMKRIMSVDLNVGARLPAYATAMGQVMLAELDDEALSSYFKTAHLEPLTEHTLITEQALRNRFIDIRNNGFGLVKEELEPGLNSLAAPLRNAQGKVVAALNISMHSSKLQDPSIIQDVLIPEILASAKQLSKYVMNVQ